jgi:hypothetical protein
MIYFLSAKTSEGPRIKVGFTESFSQRLSAIERVNACRIDVIGTMPGTEEQEQEMLKEIADYQDHHEWFYDSPDLRQWIARQMYPEGVSDVLPVQDVNEAPTQEVVSEFD